MARAVGAVQAGPCYRPGVTPYRQTLPNEGITILTRRSTFFIRLRANARVVLRRWPFLMLLAMVPAGLLFVGSLAFRYEDADAHVGPWVAWTLLYTSGFLAGVLSLTIVTRSIRRPLEERDLPRALTFTADTVLVQDANDVVYDAGWTWLSSATASSSEIVLTLRVEPLRLLFVRRAALGAASFERLCSWLREHRLVQ